MKNQDYLFHLVHSLSKGDQDNFMRYARRHARKSELKYMQLYRAILAQESYDEALLKKRFDYGNFSEAKKQLARLILKVLRYYDDHPETQMQNRLTEIRILLDRSLYHFAMKRIRQARKIAREEERWDALRTLADYELVALPYVAKPRDFQPSREAIVSARGRAFEEQDRLRRLKDIHDTEVAAAIEETSRSGAFHPELLEQVPAYPELQLPDSQLPARARSLKYRILNVVHHQKLDFAARTTALQELIRAFDESPFLIEEEPIRYVFALGNLGMSLHVTGDYARALETSLKLLHLRVDKENIRRSVFLNFTTNISVYTLKTGDTAPFLEHQAFIRSGMRQHAAQTPPATLAYIRYLLTLDHWLAGDVRQANRLARRVANEAAGRANLQAAARCFLLIFAYEEGDPELLVYYARSWRRSWAKQPPQYAIEMSFTKWMERLADQANEQGEKKLLEEGLQHCREYLKGGFEVRADNFEFLVHWIQSRLSGRTLNAVVASAV